MLLAQNKLRKHLLRCGHTFGLTHIYEPVAAMIKTSNLIIGCQRQIKIDQGEFSRKTNKIKHGRFKKSNAAIGFFIKLRCMNDYFFFPCFMVAPPAQPVVFIK